MSVVDRVPLEQYAALAAGYDLPALADLIDRPAWMADAACREHPDVSFFPERGDNTSAARAVCAGCLVRTECLAYAVEHGEQGLWGATSETERRTIRAHWHKNAA